MQSNHWYFGFWEETKLSFYSTNPLVCDGETAFRECTKLCRETGKDFMVMTEMQRKEFIFRTR